MLERNVAQDSVDISLDFISGQLGIHTVMDMFNIFDDVIFWLKDTKGCFIYANEGFLKHVNVSSISDVIGKNDWDFSPPNIAKQFVSDDKKVLNGEFIEKRSEMNVLTNGDIAWFLTSKRPLVNTSGSIIGTYGVTRCVERSAICNSEFEPLEEIVKYVSKNYMNELSVQDLAREFHLSVSTLERRLKKYLKKSPMQFINDVRMENAKRMLVETHLSISDITIKTGYSDQSYFSRQFKKSFGILPSKFRKDFCRIGQADDDMGM